MRCFFGPFPRRYTATIHDMMDVQAFSWRPLGYVPTLAFVTIVERGGEGGGTALIILHVGNKDVYEEIESRVDIQDGKLILESIREYID